ncbi:chromate efflux transporter [Pararhizobium antarcticum]|uniref:Chromate transporter n=1 Tax=Pararhizobium antarcticum TaxID=1798805 RepID=A0A657LY37_9HYPH|nr:chromate efflux transporter [Pararhizobium antarcticum]OJF90377.1 chromate transporter [Rhizobium sp. 58]OJG00561.1 chromate transporter [Pararhizobium antarcticum]
MRERHLSAEAPPHPTLAEAARVWGRIGLLSFGGPAGQIALMHRELVDERRWVSESRFLHALNYCMLLPGPEAQQLATYIGWLLHGTRGGIIAGTLFILPGFFVILSLSTAYALFQETDWLTSLFFGLKAAVLAIVVEAVIRVGRRALKTRFALVLACLAFACLFFFAVPFPLVVFAAGLAGYVMARLQPALGASEAAARAALADKPSVIGADFRQEAASRGRMIRMLCTWLLLWIAPFILIGAAVGFDNTFTAIGLFFSKMAVVTFGGAYAVLAYVAQQAVETYQWLKPGEMLDGLALAETTPGPLVLVLTFVGFMGAFRAPVGLDPLLSGFIGASLATWVTFVPCFLWIFLGAPYVETLRNNRALSAALSAISAAVTGVILNLALWFGLHVLFADVGRFEAGPISMPLPDPATLQPAALALSLLAAILLFRLKRGVVTTLAVCAAAGFLLQLV